MEIVAQQTAGVVSFNFEEIKAELEKQMQVYSSLVFTEEQKADAKKDLANLRKLEKAINAKKKEVKAEYMKPYTDFEMQIKELLQLISEPINLINKQVAEFDRKQKEEKRAKIQEAYSELIGENTFITLESIYKKEWENVSTSMKSIKNDISAKISNIKVDIGTLESFHSDAFDRAKEMYISNGYNLQMAIQFIQQYEAQKKEIIEKEQERKAEGEQLKGQIDISDCPGTLPPGGFVIPPVGEATPKSIVTFQVTATHEQLADLREFLITNSIEYKEI